MTISVTTSSGCSLRNSAMPRAPILGVLNIAAGAPQQMDEALAHEDIVVDDQYLRHVPLRVADAAGMNPKARRRSGNQ